MHLKHLAQSWHNTLQMLADVVIIHIIIYQFLRTLFLCGKWLPPPKKNPKCSLMELKRKRLKQVMLLSQKIGVSWGRQTPAFDLASCWVRWGWHMSSWRSTTASLEGWPAQEALWMPVKQPVHGPGLRTYLCGSLAEQPWANHWTSLSHQIVTWWMTMICLGFTGQLGDFESYRAASMITFSSSSS